MNISGSHQDCIFRRASQGLPLAHRAHSHPLFLSHQSRTSPLVPRLPSVIILRKPASLPGCTTNHLPVLPLVLLGIVSTSSEQTKSFRLHCRLKASLTRRKNPLRSRTPLRTLSTLNARSIKSRDKRKEKKLTYPALTNRHALIRSEIRTPRHPQRRLKRRKKEGRSERLPGKRRFLVFVGVNILLCNFFFIFIFYRIVNGSLGWVRGEKEMFSGQILEGLSPLLSSLGFLLVWKGYVLCWRGRIAEVKEDWENKKKKVENGKGKKKEKKEF